MTPEENRIYQRSIKLFKDLYSEGISIGQVEEIGNWLNKLGEKALDNPKNSIGALSNGQIEIY